MLFPDLETKEVNSLLDMLVEVCVMCGTIKLKTKLFQAENLSNYIRCGVLEAK